MRKPPSKPLQSRQRPMSCVYTAAAPPASIGNHIRKVRDCDRGRVKYGKMNVSVSRALLGLEPRGGDFQLPADFVLQPRGHRRLLARRPEPCDPLIVDNDERGP